MSVCIQVLYSYFNLENIDFELAVKGSLDTAMQANSKSISWRFHQEKISTSDRIYFMCLKLKIPFPLV
jgi:hypothetical protein